MASTTLPAASAFTGASVTEGAFKTALTDLRTMISEVLGTNATGTQGAKDGFVMLGKAYINDDANGSMSIGLTINQGANDNEILTLKSSDVAHGMTSQTETDSYLTVTKNAAATGGVAFWGYSAGTTGFKVTAAHTTDSTTKSSAGYGSVVIDGNLKSGASYGAQGANANILSVGTALSTRFILDADGDSHQDVGTAWTNFDHLDDIETLNALAYNVARRGDPIKQKFGEFMKERKAVLKQQRIVTFNRDGRHFVNMSRLTMLHTGALRQLGERFAGMAERMDAMQQQLQRVAPALPGAGA